MKRNAKVLAAAVVLLAIGVGAFFGVRAGTGGGQEAGEVGGGGPAPPVLTRLTEGDWVPPATSPDVFERSEAALQAEIKKPVFEGEFNGFLFGAYARERPRPFHCLSNDTRRLTGDEAKAASPLKLGYLPPNTWEEIVVAYVCPDGVANVVAYELLVAQYYQISVNYFRSTEAVLVISTSSERVEATTVNGHPGVVVRPVTPEGYGRSAVAFKTDEGYVHVYGADIPLEEVIKVAEGVTCADC